MLTYAHTLILLFSLVGLGVLALVVMGVLVYRATRPMTPVERSLALVDAYHGGFFPRQRDVYDAISEARPVRGWGDPELARRSTEATAIVLEAVTHRPFRGPFAWK